MLLTLWEEYKEQKAKAKGNERTIKALFKEYGIEKHYKDPLNRQGKRRAARWAGKKGR